MISLKEKFESIQEDEILVLTKGALLDSVESFVKEQIILNYSSDTRPETLNHYVFKLKDLKERDLGLHLNYLKNSSVKSERSYCKRRQVGALIVKDKNIIAEGYNGTPSGFENNCEDCNGETLWFVQHAEANAIFKVAKSTQSSDGSTLYNTLCPCCDCSKMILGVGITNVFFSQTYKTFEGIELLWKAGVNIYYTPKKLF